MKNNLLLAAAFTAAIGANAFAQDTIPALTIDSTLFVGDSASFSKNVHIGEKMTVEGLTALMDDVTAGRNFTVEEDALFKGNVTIQGTLFYPNAPAAQSLDHSDVFVFNPISGLIEVASMRNMQNQFYELDCSSNSPTWTNAPNKIFVDCPDVRVGIGTNAPSATLHVAGNGLFESTLQTGNIGIGVAPSTFSRMKIKSGNYAAGLEVDNTGNTSQFNKLIFLQYDNPSTEIIKVVNSTTGHVPFFMESNGRLTIHNGDRKILQLDTNGVLNTRTVKVDTYAWPDYVFLPDYDLRTLDDMRAFVTANGHLPNIPSAEQVETQGVDLAEMDKALTKTVEELYLYILQLEERIRQLEAVKN